jgi:ABC-type multidrug transport system fused ATPase/permease subunit
VWLTYPQENKFHKPLSFYQGLFAFLGMSSALFMFFAGMALTIISTRASRSLYTDSVKNILFSPMSFFDTTPMGRIMCIMGKDMDQMDNQLAENFRQGVLMIASVGGRRCCKLT